MNLQLLELPRMLIVTGELEARNLIWNMLLDQAQAVRAMNAKGAGAEAISHEGQLSMLSYQITLAPESVLITGEAETLQRIAGKIYPQAESWTIIDEEGMPILVKFPHYAQDAAEMIHDVYEVIPHGWQFCETHERLEREWHPDIGCTSDIADDPPEGSPLRIGEARYENGRVVKEYGDDEEEDESGPSCVVLWPEPYPGNPDDVKTPLTCGTCQGKGYAHFTQEALDGLPQPVRFECLDCGTKNTRKGGV